jgi:hypothetical protein
MADPQPPSTIGYVTPERQSGLPRSAITVLKFLFAMAACTAACTAFWQTCVTDILYHCSDSVWLDYLQGPGGWVHGAVAGRPGNFGDTIRPGWSLGRLEALWISLLAASVVLSLVFSRIRRSGVPHNAPG